MEFKLILPQRPPGGGVQNNGDGKFTYHHILPYRYFWLLGWVNLLGSGLVSHSELLRTLGTVYLEKLIRKPLFFSVSSPDDSVTLDLPPHSVERCKSYLIQMGRRTFFGQNQVETVLRQPPILTAIVCPLCTSPNYGGFMGPDSPFRSDDPGFDPERRKPATFDLVKWEALMAIARRLLLMCSDLGKYHSPGSLVAINVTSDDIVQLLHEQHILLTHDRLAGKVHSAIESDWLYKSRFGNTYWKNEELTEADTNLCFKKSFSLRHEQAVTFVDDNSCVLGTSCDKILWRGQPRYLNEFRG